jgi:hypothetical protein
MSDVNQDKEEPTLTLGEKRVRTTFNPANDSAVQHIKERAAELINYINDNVNAPEDLPKEDLGEFVRLKSLAMTDLESAAGWAVKAATTKK